MADDSQSGSLTTANPGDMIPPGTPEKFIDQTTGQIRVADLVKSYVELEKGKSGKQASAPAAPTATTPPTPPAPTGLPGSMTVDGLTKEFEANGGKLTKESMDKLAAAGIGEDLVNRFIENERVAREALVASDAAREQEVFTEFGGEKVFRTAQNWARTALPPDQRKAYDDAVSSGDPSRTKQATQWLKHQFETANGSVLNLIGGSTNQGNRGVVPFASRSEILAAQSDKRYKTDTNFRQDVERRIAVTPDSAWKVQ